MHSNFFPLVLRTTKRSVRSPGIGSFLRIVCLERAYSKPMTSFITSLLKELVTN